jgi:hypothetical protein
MASDNPNPLCECPLHGQCERHKMRKTRRVHELCSGNAGKKGLKYFLAWEQGKAGANQPEKPATKKDVLTGFASPSDHVSTIGTVLETIIEERGAKIQCGNCRWEVRRLNMMTKAEAKDQREELAAKITESARTKSPKLYQRIAASVDHLVSSNTPIPSLVHKMVLGWVDESIEKGEIVEQPKKQKRKRNQRIGKVHNSPTIPDEPLPFTDTPKVTLMFHVYPRGEAWKQHVEKLAPILPKCDRLMLGVATDHSTYSLGETVGLFGDQWEVFHAENRPSGHGKSGLREVATYSQMLPELPRGQNDITLCLHGKGSQPHTKNDAIGWWIDAMYETVAYNLDGVIEEMANGAAIVGSFRRHGRFLGTKHNWHYTGTYYAFRNAIAFSNGVPTYRQIWWGTESWSGDHFPISSSACLFGDRANDLYKIDQQPRRELEQWRLSHDAT